MLFKWVLLLIIAWYVTKAVGNVILALRGVPIETPRNIDPRNTDPRNTDPRNVDPRTTDTRQHAKSGVNVSKPVNPTQSASKSNAAKPVEIEDARFKDV